MDYRALTAVSEALERRKRGETTPVALPGSDLQGALLLRADLVAANLEGAKLDMGNLSGAKLGRARLADASMKSAQLDGADLTEADLTGAILDHARVRGACFAGAKLLGASIKNWVGVPDTVAGMKIDKETCDRSALDDSAIVELFRAGAHIVDLKDFSTQIRSRCVINPSGQFEAISEEQVLEAEATVRKAKLTRDLTIAPARRASGMMKALSMAPATAETSEADSVRVPLHDVLPSDLVSLAGVVLPPEHDVGDIVLEGFELVSQIGHGSNASVWRAKTADGDVVAVKLFDMRRYGSGLSLHAFRRGLKTMNRAMLDEAPCDLLPLQAVARNLLGYVADVAENGSVQDLPSLRWPTKRIIELFKRICLAIDRAHEHGLLHRCLKPSNILLDADLKPLIADFDMVDLPTLGSESDAVGGYASYAAPEEILDTSTMSPTADIYSLGKILSFLISGEEPSSVTEEVPALAHLSKQPAGLIRIIRKCTLRDPAVRYQGVSDLIADLSNYEDYENVGLAGGALETNFSPYRISSLPPVGLAIDDEAAALEALSLLRPRKEKPNEAVSKLGPAIDRDVESGWMARGTEIRLATLAIAAGVLSLIALALTPIPTSSTISTLYVGCSVAAAGATLFLPRFETKLVRRRLVFAAAAIAVVLSANPGRLANARLRLTLRSSDAAMRSTAVKRLTEGGFRDFSGVNLEGAELANADLMLTNLQQATLRAARLDGASCNEALFDGADLTDATALGTDFYLANPYAASGWDTVRCDETTRMPAGWACEAGAPAPLEM